MDYSFRKTYLRVRLICYMIDTTTEHFVEGKMNDELYAEMVNLTSDELLRISNQILSWDEQN